jgi:hypothetical protein
LPDPTAPQGVTAEASIFGALVRPDADDGSDGTFLCLLLGKKEKKKYKKEQ